jgi:hypothetical protein
MEIICRQGFGVLVRLAVSGMYKPASAPSARSASPGARVGVFIISSPACWAARTASRTVPYFIQNATTGFIASIFPSRNRVSPKEPFEGPEPYDGKLSRPVLRGLGPSNGGWLLGDDCFVQHRYRAEHLEYGCEVRGACSRSAVQDKSIQVKSPAIAVELTLAPKH